MKSSTNNLTKIGISLGNVCNSAAYGVQTGLRGKKEIGYKTCPFDLMVSNYEGVVKCIEDDFAHFCDTRYLKKLNVLANTYYRFQFNHEWNPHSNIHETQKWAHGRDHFVKDNYKLFCERYQRRIANFKSYLQDPNNYIVFIIQFRYDTDVDPNLKKLQKALKLKYPKLKYEIRVIQPSLQLVPESV